MISIPTRTLPTNPRRVLLINPTKYLGNLLIAGGLIQEFAAQCRQQHTQFAVVLDAMFAGLVAPALEGVQVFWYPRQAVRRAAPWRQFTLWMDFVAQLRRFQADLAFNIEEDTLSSRLTQVSGAGFRLGSSPERHGFGFHAVVPVQHGTRHRWFGYQQVFTTLGMADVSTPSYMKLSQDQPDRALIQKLDELGNQPDRPLIAIHPAATKDYKKWPEAAFTDLCKILISKGFQPALIGSGDAEFERCERIRVAASDGLSRAPLNLCNRLSLPELAQFFRLCRGIVGNDSGPSHLASALGVPGVVIFGPSDPAIWQPLGRQTRVFRKAELCDPGCSRRTCLATYRCLAAIRPEEVFAALEIQFIAGAHS